MEDFRLTVEYHEASSSQSPKMSTYADLLRLDSAKFAKRHLAESFEEAVEKYDSVHRRNLHQQTFFLAKMDAQFYHIPDDYIISTLPLMKLDFKDANESDKGPKNPANIFIYITKGTYCIWQQSANHYNRHMWDDFNHRYKGVDPRRIKRIFKEDEPEDNHLRPNGNRGRRRGPFT